MNEAVIAAHATIRHVVEHGWLHLLQLEDQRLERRTALAWLAVDF